MVFRLPILPSRNSCPRGFHSPLTPAEPGEPACLPECCPPTASAFPTRWPSDSANPLVSEFDRGAVPEGLVTRRQLRDMGLSPGGNRGPVAILRCRLCRNTPQWSCRHPTRGFLLRVDLAAPKRKPTLAQEWALDRAMAKRQTCPVPTCGRRYEFCLQAAVLHQMQHISRCANSLSCSWCPG
ncbi:RRQRL motif-containing zinc-binding protein [Streptomyces sp. NPDC051561]|uniref:RRQRL motif-containing zinc-binding protein n=1 Tax=Streptomyces sp. NPDC051561 TaxID=3365658 RepID=UPI0037B9B070